MRLISRHDQHQLGADRLLLAAAHPGHPSAGVGPPERTAADPTLRPGKVGSQQFVRARTSGRIIAA
jgi:hypothetical protein